MTYSKWKCFLLAQLKNGALQLKTNDNQCGYSHKCFEANGGNVERKRKRAQTPQKRARFFGNPLQ